MAKSTDADRLKVAKDRVAKLEAESARKTQIAKLKADLDKLKRPKKKA